MKKFACGLLAGVLISSSVAYGASVIKSAEFNTNKVIFNGKQLDLSAQPMVSVIAQGSDNASNYMPVRAVLEGMGYQVDWDNASKAVVVKSKGAEIAPTTTTAPVSPQTTNKPTISKSEFDKIENGMSYNEVKEIIGSEGELLSEAGDKGTEFYTVMYSWKGEGSIGANANAMFQNGKLASKAQFGLK